MFNFVGNESLNISDKRKMVSPSHSFTFTLKIQVKRTNQIINNSSSLAYTWTNKLVNKLIIKDVNCKG